MTAPGAAGTARPIDYRALTEVALLGGTATLLLVKGLRGQLDYYIHPRYTLLAVASALVLLLMAGARLHAVFSERPARGPGWVTLLLALPLLLGTLVPAQPLGASTLAGRGFAPQAPVVAPAGAWQLRDSEDTRRWNLLEWSLALTMRGEQLVGQPADVVGFVFHEPGLGPDAFYITRFVITCCAADGAAVGLPVLWADGGTLPADSWVRVYGRITTTTLAGRPLLAIVATRVEPIARPEYPYLYP